MLSNPFLSEHMQQCTLVPDDLDSLMHKFQEGSSNMPSCIPTRHFPVNFHLFSLKIHTMHHIYQSKVVLMTY